MNQTDIWRSTLEELLSNEGYQAYYRDQRNLLQRIWDAVKGWILDLINKWFDGLSPSSATGDLIVLILLMFSVGVVFFLVIHLTQNWHLKKRLKNNQPLKGLSSAALSRKDYQKALAMREAEENYQEAVRLRFLILLVELDQKQLLKKELWKTNWDYYQELKRLQKDKAKLFYQLAIYFEAVTYGNKQVERGDYQMYVSQLQAFEQGE